MDQLLPCMYLTKSSRLSDCQSMESRSWTLWFISSISPGDVTSVHRRSSHSQLVKLNCIPIRTCFAVLNGGLFRCGETKSAL
ncbi:hypothetical protein LINPERHAP1_LOCUS43146, partial [Linum perenne]